ncbi:hypothetical protein JCM10207_006081 [Rhodosporidiobolus poonsookiae]
MSTPSSYFASSFPPPPNRPFPPPRRINTSKLPPLVCERLYRARLVPWSDPDFALDGGTQRSDTPAWSLSLESFYRMMHPGAWEVLEEEYGVQKRYRMELGAWAQEWYECAGQEEKEEKEEVVREVEGVQEYMWTLYKSFYGLHFIRNRYLLLYRPLAPAWTDAEILNATLEFEFSPCNTPLFCGVADHSVWPLPLPSPASPKPLTLVADLPQSALRQYITPAFDHSYPDRFCAMSIEDFCMLYSKAAQKKRTSRASSEQEGGVKGEGAEEEGRDEPAGGVEGRVASHSNSDSSTSASAHPGGIDVDPRAAKSESTFVSTSGTRPDEEGWLVRALRAARAREGMIRLE